MRISKTSVFFLQRWNLFYVIVLCFRLGKVDFHKGQKTGKGVVRTPRSSFHNGTEDVCIFAPLIKYPTVDPVAFCHIVPLTRLATLNWEFGHFHFFLLAWFPSAFSSGTHFPSIFGKLELARFWALNFPRLPFQATQDCKKGGQAFPSSVPWCSGQPILFCQVCLWSPITAFYPCEGKSPAILEEEWRNVQVVKWVSILWIWFSFTELIVFAYTLDLFFFFVGSIIISKVWRNTTRLKAHFV